ncbi:MAG: hypothetical protein KKD44_29340 [Proteobacteria bacterium]|nr:hypothetical protein [Pseudomonadota bacterium]
MKMKKRGMIILVISDMLILGILCLIGVTTKEWFHEVGKAQLIASYCSPLLVLAFALPPLILLKFKAL